MRAATLLLFYQIFSLINFSQAAESSTYGQALCLKEDFYCLTVQEKEVEVEIAAKTGIKKVKRKIIDSWEILWPDPKEREIIMKINRINIKTYKGLIVAVPRNLKEKVLMDYSHYPHKINFSGKKLLIWDPKLLAWAAYDEVGDLINWGPGVGGKDWCPDIHRSCKTLVGNFQILVKQGPNYRSHKYPLGCSGLSCALMPWYMGFNYRGYGFHGSNNVPGRNASHGCVRLFTDDAEWLNKNFVDIGTVVLINPY